MLKLSEDQKQLGTLHKGAAKSFSVQVTNTGTSPISGISTRVGCGACTAANIDKSSLNPKESATMSVTFKPNSTGMNMPKTISINYSENSQTNVVVFTFISTVVN